MANVVIDFANDNGYQLLNQIAVKHQLPPYVLLEHTQKLANEDSRTTCAMLAPAPCFPTDGRAACWLSHAYYLQQRDKLSAEQRTSVERFLAKRAAFWDIQDDVQQLVAREVEVIKQAEACDEQFPLRNAEEVAAAWNWLTSAYRQKQAMTIAFEDRVNLAGRLMDAKMPKTASAADIDLLWRASCRRGCYDGKKVAKEINASIQLQTKLPAARLADMCQDLIGAAMQSQHKNAAAICDRLHVFKDRPAELAIAMETTEPVYYFPSGSVVKQADCDAFSHREFDIYRRENQRIGKVAIDVGQLQDETAAKLEAAMDNAGVSFIARKPREVYAVRKRATA